MADGFFGMTCKARQEPAGALERAWGREGPRTGPARLPGGLQNSLRKATVRSDPPLPTTSPHEYLPASRRPPPEPLPHQLLEDLLPAASSRSSGDPPDPGSRAGVEVFPIAANECNESSPRVQRGSFRQCGNPACSIPSRLRGHERRGGFHTSPPPASRTESRWAQDRDLGSDRSSGFRSAGLGFPARGRDHPKAQQGGWGATFSQPLLPVRLGA